MSESYEQTRLRLETFAKEANPDADLAPGSVLSELLIKFAATLHNPIKNDIDTLGQAKSVTAALLSAEDTYSDVITNIASNYNVVRNEGRQVTGKIKILVTTSKKYFLDAAFSVFQAGIQATYTVTQAYTVDPAFKVSDLLSSNEILLHQEGAQYYFVLPVVAQETGKKYQVSHNTQFALGTNSRLSEMVTIAAYGAFTSGRDKETDRELITRFKLGLTTKNLVSVNAINAVLKEKFPTVKQVSVIGANDAELLRAKNNLFGFAVPGMADVYVRTTESLETKQLTVEGSRKSAGEWTLTIPADAAPGFYKVLSIIAVDLDAVGTYVFNKVTYTRSVSDAQKRINNIYSAAEARFTKYQGCTVDFAYSSSALKSNFYVTVLHQPYIDEIQDLFLSDNERVACADYLVKSVIPCNVSISLRLLKKGITDTIPEQKIKQDIHSYINNIPFGEELNVSKIIDICHNYNIKRVDLPITVKGVIIVPNTTEDEYLTIEGADTLAIPTVVEKGISPQTTAFFVNYFDSKGEDNISIVVI